MNGLQEKKKLESVQNVNRHIGIEKRNKMIGCTFGVLTVVSESEHYSKKHKKFKVVCIKCGCNYIMYGDNIRRHAKTDARGCKLCYHSSKTHGVSNHEFYKTWEGMVRRCYSEKHEAYKNYGGRGIIVCENWLKDPESFLHWLSDNNYNKDLTLDRFDNDKGYSPGNCRVVTLKVNMNNKSNNRSITVFGNKMTISQASDKFGVRYTTIKERLSRGWSDNESVKEVTHGNKRS